MPREHGKLHISSADVLKHTVGRRSARRRESRIGEHFSEDDPLRARHISGFLEALRGCLDEQPRLRLQGLRRLEFRLICCLWKAITAAPEATAERTITMPMKPHGGEAVVAADEFTEFDTRHSPAALPPRARGSSNVLSRRPAPKACHSGARARAPLPSS